MYAIPCEWIEQGNFYVQADSDLEAVEIIQRKLLKGCVPYHSEVDQSSIRIVYRKVKKVEKPLDSDLKLI